MADGQGAISISAVDDLGYLRIFLSEGEATERLGLLLSEKLMQWTEQNPDQRIRAAVPITRKGFTVEMHVFLENPPD